MNGGDPFQVPGGVNYSNGAGGGQKSQMMYGYAGAMQQAQQPYYGPMVAGAPAGVPPAAGWGPQGAMPIMQQPGGPPNYGQPGMQQQLLPAAIVPYGPGGSLQYLAQIDQLVVQQKVELLEAFTGWESCNKYQVMNNLGNQVFFAAEESGCCTRICCGPIRSFDMKIMDMNQQEVLSFHRPLRCDSCCCFCCLQEMEVYAGPGTLLGSVVQNWSIFKPSFSIKDANGVTMFNISGPFCTFSLCGDVEFQVYSAMTGEEVGKISKKWTGFVKEAFTDADNFSITFPYDTDVKMKAVLLAALFLIDFMFFEKSNNKEHDNPGMW